MKHCHMWQTFWTVSRERSIEFRRSAVEFYLFVLIWNQFNLWWLFFFIFLFLFFFFLFLVLFYFILFFQRKSFILIFNWEKLNGICQTPLISFWEWVSQNLISVERMFLFVLQWIRHKMLLTMMMMMIKRRRRSITKRNRKRNGRRRELKLILW